MIMLKLFETDLGNPIIEQLGRRLFTSIPASIAKYS